MRTTSPIAGLFGRSPFRRMQQHMAFVADCVAQMLPLFEALLEEDREKIAALKETVFDLERQADDVKNEIRLHLPRTMFLPVDRRDLLDLLHAQDSIADTAQDVVGLLVLRGMVVPPFMRERLMPFVRSNVDAVNKCQEVINELDELLVTGFKSRRWWSSWETSNGRVMSLGWPWSWTSSAMRRSSAHCRWFIGKG